MNNKEFKKYLQFINNLSNNEEKIIYIDKLRDGIETLHFNSSSEQRKNNLDIYSEILFLLSKHINKTKDDFEKLKNKTSQERRMIIKKIEEYKEKIKDLDYKLLKIEKEEDILYRLISKL